MISPKLKKAIDDHMKNIDKRTYGDLADLCRMCKTKEEAAYLVKEYAKVCEKPEYAGKNIGYLLGYFGEEERKRLYAIFDTDHPIFGPTFGRQV